MAAISSRKQQHQAMITCLLLWVVVVPPASGTGDRRTPTPAGKCPVNAVKLGVCADGLIHAEVGQPPKEPCCSLISGLADLEAAVCVCLAINANVLGIGLDVAVDLSLLVHYCGRTVPAGFQCA